MACANERHPWDVRGKVGSERKFATSERHAKIRQTSVISRSVVIKWDFARGGPQIPSTDRGIWPKKSPIGTWDAAVRRAKRPIGMPRKQRTLRTADAHLSITIAPGSMSTYIPKNRSWVPKSAPELLRPRMNGMNEWNEWNE